VRVDGTKVSKPAHALKVGVTLTFAQAKRIRIIQVDSLATRRGPAPEAQALYTDLTPPEEKKENIAQNPKFEGKGRPTKKDRRNARLSRFLPLE
jgi:ribosome-associated heat shock protein Hsp15